MFIVALFTVVKTQRHPRCPLVDGWVKKTWYIKTMEYYSSVRKNDTCCPLQQHGWTLMVLCSVR